MVSKTDENFSGIYIKLPLPEERLFRNQATEDILMLLARNPHREFSITEIRNITGSGGDTVQTALEVLEKADLVQIRQKGRKKLVSSNPNYFYNPDDPLLSIPQQQFRPPVKKFLEKTEESQGKNLAGVILFGSVARGEADRTSDIDIQVIVEENLTDARRKLQEIRKEVENTRFDGDRYEIHLLVESTETAKEHGKKLQEIISEGIKLCRTEKLEEVEEEILYG